MKCVFLKQKPYLPSPRVVLHVLKKTAKSMWILTSNVILNKDSKSPFPFWGHESYKGGTWPTYPMGKG